MRTLLLLLLAVGCGPTINTTAFNYRFADNRAEDVAAILQGTPGAAGASTSNATGEPLIVATTHAEEASARQVVALRPSGETLWSVTFDARTRPEILGDVIMTSSRQEVVALDLRNGSELWRQDDEGLAYVGATRSGNTIMYVVSVGVAGGATRVGHIRAVDARTGSRLWDYEIAGILGRPEAYGQYVFIPWDRQNIAILDIATGFEKARLRSTDDVIAWVHAHPSGLYYGGPGIYRFDERSANGVKSESTYRQPPIPGAPREPTIEDDGFYPMPGTRSARGRIRIYFAPSGPTEGSVSVVGGRFYYVYYRYVFAFDDSDQLVWARMLDQDVIRAEVLESGFFVVGEGGAFRLLDTNTGADRWTG
ncbi:MAG: PQQ-binding-like beta-propeller repeat protein, partial [Myxococcota bacterium]